MEKREGELSASASADTAEIARELARRMMDKAMVKSMEAQAAIDSAIDAAFVAVGAAADFSSDRLVEVKVMCFLSSSLSDILHPHIFLGSVCEMSRNKISNLRARSKLN